MRISLFIPCFVDQYYPEAAMAMASILEGLGHTVEYDPRQTCCGQPAFNSGYWAEARSVAGHMLDVFRDAEAVVGLSGSCSAMVRVFNPELFEGDPRLDEARALAAKTWEFTEFLVDKLGAGDLGARFPHKVVLHDGCHGLRELGIRRQPRHLLSHVSGLELVEMKEADTCCGFGGTFSAKFPAISAAMGEVKIDSILETGAGVLASIDLSCIMHIEGMLRRVGHPIRAVHVAEILASR